MKQASTNGTETAEADTNVFWTQVQIVPSQGYATITYERQPDPTVLQKALPWFGVIGLSFLSLLVLAVVVLCWAKMIQEVFLDWETVDETPDDAQGKSADAEVTS